MATPVTPSGGREMESNDKQKNGPEEQPTGRPRSSPDRRSSRGPQAPAEQAPGAPAAAPPHPLARGPRDRGRLRRLRPLLQHRSRLRPHRGRRARLRRRRGRPPLPRRPAPHAERRGRRRRDDLRPGAQPCSRHRGRRGAAPGGLALSSRRRAFPGGSWDPARSSRRHRRSRLVARLRRGAERRRAGRGTARGARHRDPRPLRDRLLRWLPSRRRPARTGSSRPSSSPRAPPSWPARS